MSLKRIGRFLMGPLRSQSEDEQLVENQSGDIALRLRSADSGVQKVAFTDFGESADWCALQSAGDGALQVISGSNIPGMIGGGRALTADDEDVTLAVTTSAATSDIDRTVLVYTTALTAERTVTLTTAGAYAGMVWRVVRAVASTGAFDLNVGALRTLSPGEWADVIFDGTNWVLAAFGGLATSALQNYSESEQDTGRKWIGAETVYSKTVDTGALPNATSKNVAHGITGLDRLIHIIGAAKNTTSGDQLPLPYADDLDTFSVKVVVNATNIILECTVEDRSAMNESYVTLLYTRT